MFQTTDGRRFFGKVILEGLPAQSKTRTPLIPTGPSRPPATLPIFPPASAPATLPILPDVKN